MTSFGPETYGESFAEVYDQWYGQITDAEATADFVSRRCEEGPILEVGVGTGRLALPLISRGHKVIGLDASPTMLKQCSPSVNNVLGDMANLPFGSNHFGAALCAFNTLFNLPSEQLQSDFLAQVASCLRPHAPLIIEAITGYDLGANHDSSLGVSRIEADRLVLSATMVDSAAQTITGQHVDITSGPLAEGIKLRPWKLRWTTPDQLDALASEAGLELFERYSDWQQGKYDPLGETHISVYLTPWQ